MVLLFSRDEVEKAVTMSVSEKSGLFTSVLMKSCVLCFCVKKFFFVIMGVCFMLFFFL